MDIIKKGFGNCLKNSRKIKNLTQEKLAEQIGVNLRQLARIEAGESFVTSETLFKICSVLEVSPKALFDYDIYKESLMSNTDETMHFSVIKSGNILQLVNEAQQFKAYSNNQNNTDNKNFDEQMMKLGKHLKKNIVVDEIQDGIITNVRTYTYDGKIKTISKNIENKEFENLKNKLNEIAKDTQKLEFLNLAYDSLFNKDALDELKILIKGFELSRNI